MTQYLQRLNIASVEEVGVDATMPHYLKRVNVVEVVDSDGNPWEPVPGPDPWDQLVVADKSKNNDGPSANIGDTISFTTATYTGGDPDSTIYRYRFQTRDTPEDGWTNGSWTSYDNTTVTVTKTVDSPGQMKFQSQARDTSTDPVTQVNSFSSTVTVPAPPLVVGTPVASGLPFVGETITCSQPTVSGGVAPYTYIYTWKVVQAPAEGAWSTGSAVVVPKGVVGKTGFCEVTVEDAFGTTEIVSSNPLGPVEYREFGDISVTVNDLAYDTAVAPLLTILMNDPLPAVVSITGDATPTYTWGARAEYPLMVGTQGAASTVLTFPSEGNAVVTCDLRDPNTEEVTTSIIINFFVVDAFD